MTREKERESGTAAAGEDLMDLGYVISDRRGVARDLWIYVHGRWGITVAILEGIDLYYSYL